MDLDRSSVALYGARIVISLVGFISTVYFARELGSSGLGLYFTFETVVNVLAVFSRFGVDNAVIKRMSAADTDAERGRYLTGALAVVTVPFVCVSLVVLLARGPLDALFELALVPLLVVVLAVETAQWVLISALRGEQRIATTAGLELLGELARIGVSVGLVLAGFGAVGLVYGLMLGQFLRAVAAAGLIRTRLRRPTRETVRSLLSFSKYAAGMNVSHLAYSWFDTLVLALLASKAAVGVYESAWRVSLVVMLASSSIGVALAPSVSSWHASEEWDRIESAVSEAVTYALLLVVPAVVGVAVLGEAFMEVVYRFETGGLVLVVLVAEKLLQAVKDVAQSTLLGTERERVVFWTNAVTVAANVALNLLLVPVFGMLGAAVATFATAGTAAVLQVAVLRRSMAFGVDRRAVAWQVGAALAMGAAVVLASRAVPPTTVPRLFGLIGLGVAVYGLCVLGHGGMRTRLLAVLPRPGSS
ncbi:oligosaccharide flippase family protein [Halomarina ordinaria]|uniref:Oligosaccharide flippase family protein n=1 Tax=Halomarina ordinaria TaxID=3033939 RepID=A0ABD5UFU7_9EURY|nr:oligosaccharide flippase family protein [Halomarina sp. PSRA2]